MALDQLEFKYPFNSLYFILVILAVILLLLAYRKKEKIMGLLQLDSIIRFKISRLVLLVLGLILIVSSLLGPQVFKGYRQVNKKGLDIYVLIDTSKSMLVEDVKPDRLSRAKKIIGKIIDQLSGDRIGFIPFSSAAYIQMPLTDDYQLAHMFLNVIDTDMIAGGGTNIGQAIKLAEDSFQRSASTDQVLIILSDGEEHDPQNLDYKSFAHKNIKIYTIGIGTQKGGLVPVYDPQSGEKAAYLQADDGEFVVSHLQDGVLKKLASSAGGSYYRSSLSGQELPTLLQKIATLKKGVLKTQKIRKFTQLYQYFLALGILLFLLAYLLPEGRRRE